ncbi:L7Ae/L30e/S12e/Gadd45 family ribosomal protein [Carboxydothermus pertinax]|uniref:50S ribosomal protein L7/L12 n=1 Tax=Carboxydothermus pertinax TaxID=870242 RepID=A0A1L8CX54_9THEO|nr:ribosomal L7Ae/L30e/S12e/Gadd45 family protein [Carboxydothermus pertinax]GAV23490.1 50S ribosomal protein L7/L12 [Carboxydothermus pertinax]
MNKVEGILGLALRAKKLLVGETEVLMGIKKRQIVGIILAIDLAESQKRKFEFLAKENGLLKVNWGTKEKFGRILNRRPTGILGFKDSGFWQKILQEIGYDQGVN